MGLKTRGVVAIAVPYIYRGIGGNGSIVENRSSSLIPYAAGYELMVSDEPRFRHYGTCDHLKVTPAWNQDPVGPWWSSDGSRHTFSNRLGGYGVTPVPNDYDVDWETLSKQAFDGMKPSLDAGFSLSNFLFELREIKTLFKLFSKRKELSRNAAGLYLNYQFGWKPFISDLIDLYELLRSWRSRYYTYMFKQNRELTRHWSKTLEKNAVKTFTRTVPYRNTYAVVKRTVKYTATMRYKYVVKGFESQFRTLKAILDTFGLKLSASAVWEALPFSFVVDWIFSVQDWLDQVNEDFLESVVTILDFCHSVKATSEIEHYALETYANSPFKVPLGTETRSHYQRFRALPATNEFGIALAHKYGAKQILLSAALLHA